MSSSRGQITASRAALALLLWTWTPIPPASAQPWTPGECSPELTRELRLIEEKLAAHPRRLSRRPPHPNPSTDREILADLKHAYFALRSHSAVADLLEPERSFYRGLRDGLLRFEISRVEEWTKLRCRTLAPKRFSFLVRAFRGDRELARFSVAESGALGQFVFLEPANRSTQDRFHLPAVDAGAERVRFLVEGLPPSARRAQYVSTHGRGRCDELFPCIALRHGRTTYLLQASPSEHLFAFDAADPRLSQTEVSRVLGRAREPLGDESLPTFDAERQELFSLGGDLWVRARLLYPAPEPPRE